MRDMIIGQIELGNFDLGDMLDRINYYHVAGKLTDAEREELISRAQEKAAKEDTRGQDEMLDLWGAVRELQSRVAALEADSDAPSAPEDEYPAWRNPVHLRDYYRAGEKMTYTDGRRYVCINLVPTRYGPDVYQQGWQEVT